MGIRVSSPIIRKDGFWEYIFGGKIGLRGISGLKGKALPHNHLPIPKDERKSNHTKIKRWESKLAKEKSRCGNQGVTNLPPLKRILSSRLLGLPPG
jgi:hypothetical protein